MNGMKALGKITGLQLDYKTKKPVITLELNADPEELEKLLELKLEVSLEKEKKRRSLDANAMLWACLADISRATGMTNWDAYIYELERYGKFTHILVKREALEDIKKLWRETKEVGNRGNMVELLCFFGSSTYTTSEFSRLLEGVVSDMKDLGLTPPPSEDLKRTLEAYEKQQARKKQGA